MVELLHRFSLVYLVTLSCCVFVFFNESRQSKIRNLTDVLVRHQDVGRSQVPVDVILCLNKGHAVSHLQGTAHHQTWPASVRS